MRLGRLSDRVLRYLHYRTACLKARKQVSQRWVRDTYRCVGVAWSAIVGSVAQKIVRLLDDSSALARVLNMHEERKDWDVGALT
jgi:hypothetical protein